MNSEHGLGLGLDPGIGAAEVRRWLVNSERREEYLGRQGDEERLPPHSLEAEQGVLGLSLIHI